MAPPRKSEMAFMGMMEKFFESHATCDCPDCKSSTKRLRKLTAQVSNKDIYKENLAPSKTSSSMADHDRYLCPDHRPLPPRRTSTKDKEKDKSSSNTNQTQPNRADKINKLLKAESIQAVFEVLKATQSTANENKLATDLQEATAQCKTFPESKTKIISYCQGNNVEPEAAFGLLAKFRQERGILTSAVIKSNAEREKYLQAIHEVDDLMGLLRDVAKDGKGPSSEDVRHGFGNMIFKIHELAKNPSALYEELLDLRDEHLDLLADHEEQNHKFLDIESCHEKLHEDKKKLQDDLAWEKRDHTETRKKLSALSGTKSQVNQAHKSLEKVHEENTELKKEVEKLTAELAKINALKHENTQLKKKLAMAEAAKPEVKVEEKPLDSSAASKKKKGKKGTTTSPAPTEPVLEASLDNNAKADQAREKELKATQQANAEIQSQLDNAQTTLRQLEAVLKKAEVAKTKALERQQIEQATAQNWKELSEGHQEESVRLREQLDDSVSNATNLQNSVHQLEQSVAELKEQRDKAQMQKRSASPSVQSQTSNNSRFDVESLRLLRKLRGETSQLVQDLDTAKSYPGDPWNLVECTRNMVAVIDHDLEGLIFTQRETDTPNPIPDTYLPYSRNELGLQTPTSLPRRTETPPLTAARARNPSTFRPLLPPGLAESGLGRASPMPTHLPSPIGTGRPTKITNGLTPSPTQSTAKAVNIATPGPTSIDVGAAGVDWSIWTKR